jgi:phosphatidylglycerophosphate synthase
LIGFGIAVVAAILAAMQSWLLAGVLVLFGGVFDLFDGALARATGKASRLGAFMDSVFDRWGEGVIYIGIVAGLYASGYEYGPTLAVAAAVAAFMVSYARAVSEREGFTPGKGMANVGLAPREVRIVILTAGLVVAGVLGTAPVDAEGVGGAGGAAFPAGILALDIALGLIAVLGTITVIQRVIHVLRQPAPEEHQ